MIVDAHHHLWTLWRGDYGWLTPDAGPLYRDYSVPDLQPLLAAAGIDATVVVQAAPSVAETWFLLHTALETPWIAAVVGWVDLAAPDAPDEVARLVSNPLLRGLRPMLQDLLDPCWIERPHAAAGLSAMARHALVFDALIRPSQIGSIERIARRHVDLPIVLDHAGKPEIGGDIAAWRDAITRLAACGNVSVKLSGLLTEAPPGADADALAPWFDVLLERFGPSRILWGSDWPVVTLASTYAGWLDCTAQLLAPLGDDERAAIMGGNAVRLYRLHQERP